MTKPRLFIVDAMALAFRSFHAFPRPLTTSSGLPTQAIYGSLMFLTQLIEREKPDYLLIATDSDAKTFRHEMYPEYKANRGEMPEDLAVQIPYLYRLFQAFGCFILKVPGLEADDLIGSVVQQWASSQLHCYIVSGDKDFMQLVNDDVSLYIPQKASDPKIVDINGVYDKFGVEPHQVIDLLAIMGDSSDNVPGVKGIGEKGAAKLIQTFGSLEQIYENLDQITNKRQLNGLSESKELAFLSKELVTIKTDAELPIHIAATRCTPEKAVANKRLLELVSELEFTSFSRKIEEKMAQQNQSLEPSVEQQKPEVNYKLIRSTKELSELLKSFESSPEFCVDTETTGLDISNDKPIGISLSKTAHEAYYISLQEKHIESPLEQMLALIRDFLENSKALKIGHNLKFDIQMLQNLGIRLNPPFADTMVASHLADSSERSHSLDACCLRYLNYTKIPTASVLDENKTMINAKLEDLTNYACEDADLCLQLWRHLQPIIEETKQDQAFYEVEMPLISVLAKMEQTGIYLDTQILESLSHKLNEKAEQLEKTITELAGESFNIKSPKQLQVILYEKLKVHEQLGIKRIKKTKSGYSTDISVLEKLREHPLVEAILEYRTVTKLKSTYVDTLPQIVNAKTKRLHSSFHQTGTATGRLSSSEPNLQNIPIRNPMGKQIRSAFCGQDSNTFIVSADYSQIELRILAALSKDEALAQAFKDDKDIHTSTAAKIFSVDESQVNSDQRSHAKAINFGIIYGMGASRLARETGVSMKEAKEFSDKYFESYPKIQSYIQESISFAQEHGYSKTLFGRRRYIPEIHTKDQARLANAQNMAVNSPVQGSAADLIKIAMINIQKKLDESGFSAKMLLQVHDELVFECPGSELDEVAKLVKQTMESALPSLDVPLKVQVGSGHNWLEAH